MSNHCVCTKLLSKIEIFSEMDFNDKQKLVKDIQTKATQHPKYKQILKLCNSCNSSRCKTRFKSTNERNLFWITSAHIFQNVRLQNVNLL